MHDPAVFRRLASRLGSALREARRHLPRDDPRLCKLKEVLWDLGNVVRPAQGRTLPEQLARAPPATSDLARLLVGLASRPPLGTTNKAADKGPKTPEKNQPRSTSPGSPFVATRGKNPRSPFAASPDETARAEATRAELDGVREELDFGCTELDSGCTAENRAVQPEHRKQAGDTDIDEGNASSDFLPSRVTEKTSAAQAELKKKEDKSCLHDFP